MVNTQINQQDSKLSFLLATRLNIGAAVCLTEGLTTSILLKMPRDDITIHIASAILTFITFLLFWRFRKTKLGADVGDLYFFDWLIQSIGLVSYANGIDLGGLWFVSTGISVMKMIRIYLTQNSAIQQQGFGIYGPMTWHYAKKYQPKPPIAVKRRQVVEIFSAVFIAIAMSIIIHWLPDAGRFAVSWIVPVTFEFLYGPVQLRNLKIFGNSLATLTENQEKLQAENNELKQFQQILADNKENPDSDLAALCRHFTEMSPAAKQHLLEYAENAAKQCPAKKATE